MTKKKMPRTLLIDGDILVFQVALIHEKATAWDDEGTLWTTHWHLPDAIAHVEKELAFLKEELEADHLAICLSDSGNFRKDIMPEYKDNRKDVRKPPLLYQLREYLEENHDTYIRPELEADDVMGILATHPKAIVGDKIIVSLDKDMKTIPTKVFSKNRARTLLKSGEISTYAEAVETITPEQANYNHLYQTLIGDTTDGYSGCTGVGPKAAEEILSNPTLLIEVDHEIKRGPRKGEIEKRWVEDKPCTAWEAVVCQFKKAGLSEDEALRQARVARILRWDDYDYKNKKPILWSP